MSSDIRALRGGMDPRDWLRPPTGHIATSPGEIAAHGPHADLIALTSYGSHQVRIGPNGDVISEDHNLSGEMEGEIARLNALRSLDPVQFVLLTSNLRRD